MTRLVPSARLLWLAGLIGIPALTLLGAAGERAWPVFPLLLALVGWAAWDARRARSLLASVSAAISDRPSLFLGRPGELEVRLTAPEGAPRAVRFGLNLPPQLVSPQEDMEAALPAGGGTFSVKWPCAANKRGRFQIPSAHLETLSPGGLWQVRAARALNAEVRVYPDLIAERKRVAMVFLQRRPFGSTAQRQVGKGRDFEKLRDYAAGDPLEDVHWKASAKRGHLVSKVFQIERTQEIYVAVDCSRLTNRPSSAANLETTTLDRFVTAGLLLGMATEQQGDHFGLVTFSDHVHSIIRARNGSAHFSTCRDALFHLQPRLVTPDFDELFSAIRLRLRRRSLILILTALDDPVLAESFAKSLELVSRQHLVVVCMIEPGRVEPVFKSPVQSDAEAYEALAGHLFWRKLRELETSLARRGVHFSLIPDEMLTRELVEQYLDVKRRQIL